MISVVVPVLNEESNIEPLVREIVAVDAPVSEIIYVDDGSTDGTVQVLRSLRRQYPLLRVIRHSARSGQSSALWTGIKAAGNDLIVTLDGDGQNDPADIALVYKTYKDEESRHNKRVMVAGQRLKRQDSLTKRLSSRFANKLRSFVLADKTRDTGCSLKLFRRHDYLALPYFNHMHRYIPALMIREGVRVAHVDVSHRPRAAGISKYGTLDRALVGISDLMGVRWLQVRGPSRVEVHEDLD
ncbi:MAG: glycosyltransferase family 2 protein [Micavibrio aeruginosavorus]|uniref:Glycosyltransferase family 2 protein n=1 Tax=Micavibrio aeruginosavorus TaxID=349221 RepID=A0A7T5R3G2_9BACT|nr:MAG: glycosyltransferase family 2 protein [Micavibrio aeruginosavorus]